MLLHEIGERIAASLQRSTALMHQLQQGLAARRTAWISARPSAIVEPVQAMEQLTIDLRAEDGSRAELIAAAALHMPPLPGIPAAERRIHIRQIAALLPRAISGQLQRAAAAATAASNAVRVELQLGQRLLQFSQRAHETLLHGIATDHDDVGGYDRSARRVHGALKSAGAPAGRLIDGRM